MPSPAAADSRQGRLPGEVDLCTIDAIAVDGRGERGDVGRVELPVGVDRDEEVAAVLDDVSQGGVERCAHAAVGRVTDDRRAGVTRFDDGVVGGAVVDDEYFDLVDARDVARHAADDLGDRNLLVQGRDGDEQLHRA